MESFLSELVSLDIHLQRYFVRLAHLGLQCESLLFRSLRLSSVCLSVVCLSRVISRQLGEIGAKFRHLKKKSGSKSKQMTSDFAPEVAK